MTHDHNASFRRASRACLAAAVLALAACASQPAPPPSPPLTPDTPAQMVAYIDAAAGDGAGELNVQPLRSPEVEDLRQRADRLRGQGHLLDAAAALDHAIELVPDDPALLQERAEVALLLSDFERADGLAARAQSLGPGVGPLCRRHWATREQVALVRGDGDAAEAARVSMAACRVAPPPRW
ncbi:MAG: hypothetical protein GX856_14310 [Gammaproteobacteria bacterium]|jgi:Flp pilus assembly protein TadD|nr:hypothetical protein [Gammaproteobacteria bacterium]